MFATSSSHYYAGMAAQYVQAENYRTVLANGEPPEILDQQSNN